MGLVRLMHTQTGMEAEVACALRRQHGVRCVPARVDFSHGPGVGALISATRSRAGDEFGSNGVRVHEEDVALARQALEAPIEEDAAEPGA